VCSGGIVIDCVAVVVVVVVVLSLLLCLSSLLFYPYEDVVVTAVGLFNCVVVGVAATFHIIAWLIIVTVVILCGHCCYRCLYCCYYVCCWRSVVCRP